MYCVILLTGSRNGQRVSNENETAVKTGVTKKGPTKKQPAPQPPKKKEVVVELLKSILDDELP